MRRDELFERFPPLGTLTADPIPHYPATGAGGHPVQVHLINRQAPSFHQLAEFIQKAQAHPPNDLFQVLELVDEVAVITEGLPAGMGFEAWIRRAVQGHEPPVPPVEEPPSPPAEESYTQFFRPPLEPPVPTRPEAPPTADPPGEAPQPPEAPLSAAADTPVSGSDYSEFFRVPVAGEVVAKEPEPAAPVEPPRPPVPTPPPPTQPPAAPPANISPPGPPPPYQSSPAPTPPPAPFPDPGRRPEPPVMEPDPDSITAQFRKPMPPSPQQQDFSRGRDWAPSQRGAKPHSMPMGNYLARLDSSSDAPAPGTPRPPAAPSAPPWGSGGGVPFGSQGRDASSSPTVVARAPLPHGDGTTPQRRFRTRDLVIFGGVVGLVIVATVVTVLVVLLSAD